MDKKKQKKIHGVSMIPFGLFAGFADKKEIRITEISTEGFCFRTAEKIERPKEIVLHYFVFQESRYQTVALENFQFCESECTKFFVIYTVFTGKEEYISATEKLLKEYGNYINLKLSGDDAWLSKELTGYPAELEEEHYSSFDKQKKDWFFREKYGVDEGIYEEIKLALELDNPRLYQEYLSGSLAVFTEKYWAENYLSGHPLAGKMPQRIYVGNQFCHNLFPKKEVLFAVLDKAKKENLEVTISFSYLRDYMLEDTKKLLRELSLWCTENGKKAEILVNDWAMPGLLVGTEQVLIPCLGVLLNKTRKDPRYAYKKGMCTRPESGFGREMQQYLKEKMGISRFEWEAAGMPAGADTAGTADRPGAGGSGISLHLPFYQTNTSQFCPLYARCKNGSRGNQELPAACPGYCRELVFLYPKHLSMVGRYNSLFGLTKKFSQIQNICGIIWSWEWTGL